MEGEKIEKDSTEGNFNDENDAAYSSTLTPPSAQPLPTLPFDLIVEILCRLPVKLLMQFRCICKSWNSLISDSKFAKQHLHMSTTLGLHSFHYNYSVRKYFLMSYPLDSVSAILSTNVAQLQYAPNSIDEYSRSFYFVGSCNGMLCLAHNHCDCYFLVWNPSIRKFKELPPFQKKSELSIDIKMTHGFGYDHVNDKYKVVVVLHYDVDILPGEVSLFDKTEVKVYTFGTDFWKSIKEFPFDGVPVESGKFVSGTINWLASKHRKRNGPCFIVSFDLEDESYQEILMPDYGEVDAYDLSLGVLRDSLCMISDHDVWVMKEYGNKDSWTKLFTVSDKCYAYINAMCMFEDDQVLIEYRTRRYWKKKLIVYDPRNDTFKFTMFENENSYDQEICVESLISPWS